MMKLLAHRLPLIAIAILVCTALQAQPVRIALLKYNGGGDWYANPTSLTNLIAFCNHDQQMGLNPQYATVDVGSAELFNYPFVHMTGHGNVVFSDREAQNLRTYLSVENAFTFSRMKGGWDPEYNADGSGRAYPVARVWSVGLNVKF